MPDNPEAADARAQRFIRRIPDGDERERLVCETPHLNSFSPRTTPPGGDDVSEANR